MILTAQLTQKDIEEALKEYVMHKTGRKILTVIINHHEDRGDEHWYSATVTTEEHPPVRPSWMDR